jgi:hypothetical protein
LRSSAHFLHGLLVATLLVIAAPAAAQGGLGGRTHAFLVALAAGADSAARFFPRHGDWTWVHATEYDVGRKTVGVWRFRGGEAARVLGPRGAMCGELDPDAPSELELEIENVVNGSPPWYRARGRRFVPPEMGARSPVFVEWRREDGAWVVAAIGSAAYESLPMPGADIRTAVRDTAPGLPPAWNYAEHAEWFVNSEPFGFEGRRYLKFAVPRMLPRDRLTRIATLHGIPIYAEAGSRGAPEILHVRVNPRGEFQSYSSERRGPRHRSPCRTVGGGPRPGSGI